MNSQGSAAEEGLLTLNLRDGVVSLIVNICAEEVSMKFSALTRSSEFDRSSKCAYCHIINLPGSLMT